MQRLPLRYFLPGFFGAFFVFYLGYSMILMGILKPQDGHLRFLGGVLAVAGPLFLLRHLYLARNRPDKIMQSIEHLKTLFGQDIEVIRFVTGRPTYLAIYTATMFAIAVFLFSELRYQFIYNEVLNLTDRGTFPITLYVVCFFGFLIYMTGFMTLAEVMKRKEDGCTRPLLLDIARGVLWSLPYVIVLAALWWLFLLSSDRNSNRSFVASVNNWLRSLSLYMLFVIFKYFTYTNLIVIAYEDQPFWISFEKAKAYFKQHRHELARIWLRAGATVALPTFFVVLGYPYVEYYQPFHPAYYAIAVLISFAIFVYTALLSEQIAFLRYYVAARRATVRN